MLRIVTDGAADMPAGWEEEYCDLFNVITVDSAGGSMGLVLYPVE